MAAVVQWKWLASVVGVASTGSVPTLLPALVVPIMFGGVVPVRR